MCVKYEGVICRKKYLILRGPGCFSIQVCPKYDYYKVLVSFCAVDDPTFYKMMIVIVHAKLVIAHLKEKSREVFVQEAGEAI